MTGFALSCLVEAYQRRNEQGNVTECWLDLTVDTAGVCVLVVHIGQLDSALYRLVEKYRGITSDKLKSEVCVAENGVVLFFMLRVRFYG